MKALSRRTLLRGAGAAIALPFLHSMGDPRKLMKGVNSAYAQTSGFPKRLLLVISSNGTIKGHNVERDEWTPNANFEFKYILEPLNGHKDKLVVLDGLSCQACSDAQGTNGANPHDASVTQLTGRRFKVGDYGYQDAGGGTNKGNYISPTGPSVDQEIGNRLVAGGVNTKFKTYQMLAYPDPAKFKDYGVGDSSLYYQWAGENQAILGERDPNKSFQDLFGEGAPSGPTTSDPNWANEKKKSILDGALESYNDLRAKVGADDKVLLDKHMDEIRAIEMQLESGGGGTPMGNGCVAPAAPSGTFGTEDTYPATVKVQNELMVAALACDLTRVGVLEWEPGLSEIVHKQLGQTANHHDISHNVSAQAIQELCDINNWYAKQFSDLLDSMKAVPEGDGTLLDNTMVVWLQEFSEGSTHDHNNQGIVLAGNCGGFLQTNRYVKVATTTQINSLHVSMLNAMGFTDVNQFGDVEYGSGPVPGLVV